MSRKATWFSSPILAAQLGVLFLLFMSIRESDVKAALISNITSLTQTSVNFTLESTILDATNAQFNGSFWYVGSVVCTSTDDPSCSAPTSVSNDSTYPPEVYFEGLKPGSVYSITIDGIWTNASSNDPSDLTFSFCTAPVAPDLSSVPYQSQATQITILGLDVNVVPVDNNGSLTHYGVLNSSSDGSRSAGPVAKAQSLVIYNLTSATAYTFQIYAYNDGCSDGIVSSLSFASYNACTSATGALTVNRVNFENLTVVVPSGLDSFEIVSVKDDSGTAEGTYSSGSLSADETVTDLKFGTKYTVNGSASISGVKCGGRSITGFLIGSECTNTLEPNATDANATSNATDTIVIRGLSAQHSSFNNGTTDGWLAVNTTEAVNGNGTFSEDAVFSGLTAGTEYTFSFKGYIDACTDAVSASEVTVTACTQPNAPTLAAGRSYQANQTNITIYYDDFNVSGSSDYIRVSKNSSSDDGTLSPSNGIMSTSGESVSITGLTAETTYGYIIEALFNGTSCLNTAVSDPLAASINTSAGDPNVTITSTTETTIVFTCTPSVACVGLQYQISDASTNASGTTTSTTVTNLSPGTSYNVSVDNGFDVDVACTKPVAPDFASVSYSSTLDTISILGNVSAVAATGGTGGITSFKFLSAAPNIMVPVQTSPVDSNMTIGTSGSFLLSSETMYNVTFVSVFTDSIGCPSGEEGTATTVLKLCTAPTQPGISRSGMTYVDSTNDSITIDFADLNATEAFQVVSAVDNTPSASSVPSASITAGYQESGSSVVLSSLSPATVYTVTLQASFNNSGECLNKAESTTSNTVKLCTVPFAPTLNVTSVDHETISVSVNGSSSTTVNGIVLNETSHSISPSGTFTSSGNVNNLTPGTEFTVSLALAFDTSIADCPDSAASLLAGATGSASGCTYPLAPNVSSFITSSSNFDQSTSSIRILGSTTNLTVTSGGFDQYSLNETIPSGGSVTGGPFNANEDMNITGLDSGTVYTVSLNGHVGSPCNLMSQTPVNISNLCTAPSAPNVTVISATTSSATISTTSANVSKESAAPAGESFDKYKVTHVNGNLTGGSVVDVHVDSPISFGYITPRAGTAYNVTVQSIKKESCINGGADGVLGDTATFQFCTKPAQPTVIVHTAFGYYETKVTIENITSSPGTVDLFNAAITPTPTAGGFSNKTSIDIASAANYDYDNLDAGGEYTLTVTVTKNSTDCGITQTSDLTSAETTTTVCTAPLAPDMSSVDIRAPNGSANASIVVNASPSSSITTSPSGGVLDGYEIMNVAANSDNSSVSFTGSPSVNVTNSTALTIYLPYLGTSYDLSFASVITRYCNNAYIRSEARTNVTRCTAPWQPHIADSTTAVTINQTSITIVGANINSSDTYVVANLSTGASSMTPVVGFSEERAASASADVVLANLTSGTVYNIDLVGVIGSTTPCGSIESYGDATTIKVCTDPPDITPSFGTIDSESIALLSILPNTGWDNYTITASPALPPALVPSVTNQSNDGSNTLTLSGLTPGTEYNFTTTVSIVANCDYGTNSAVSNGSVSACTEPLGPDFTGLSHNATNDTLLINSGAGNLTDPAGGGSFTNYNFSRTDPSAGTSTSGWVSKTGGQITIADLSPGRVYTAFFYGQLVGTNCGSVDGSTESNITDLCTEPSAPTISSSALTSTNDSISLLFAQVSAPSGEIIDYIQVTDVAGEPSFLSPAASTDNVTVTGLTAGTSYTLSVISTLGDITTCTNGQVKSPVANVTGCTEPPHPEIGWEGVNSTAIAISVNNTFGFDKWSATINNAGGPANSPDYTSSSDKHYFNSGLSSGTQYTVTVTLTIGDGTDCGDMSAMTSTAEVYIAEVGCNPPFPVNTTEIGFTATTATVTLVGTGSSTNDMVMSTNGTVIGGLYDVEPGATGENVGPVTLSTPGAVASDANLTISGFTLQGTVYTIQVFQNFSVASYPTCAGISTSTSMYVCTAPVPPKSDYVLNLSDNVGALKVSSFGVTSGGSANYYDFTFVPQENQFGVACSNPNNISETNIPPGEAEVFGLEPGCRYKLLYFAVCLTPDSKTASSDGVFTSSVDGCAKPSEGLTNFTISTVSATQVNVSGLVGKNGTFTDMDVIFRPDDSCTNEESKVVSNVNSSSIVSPATLAPGCPYTVLYTLNCYSNNFADVSSSAQVTSPVFGCTTPDEVLLDGIDISYSVGGNYSYFKGLTSMKTGFYQYFQYSYSADTTISVCTESGSANFSTIGEQQNITGLTPGCKYNLAISAFCGSAQGPETANLSLCAEPAMATSLQQDKSTTLKDFIPLSWSDPSGSFHHDNYLAYLDATLLDGNATSFAVNASSPNVSLSSSSSYTFYVSAVTYGCFNLTSATGDPIYGQNASVTVYTAPDAPVIDATAIDFDSIFLQYKMNANDTGTSGITVALTQNLTGGSDVPLVAGYTTNLPSTGDHLFHTVNSLTPATEYSFKAVASFQSITSDPAYTSACTYPLPVTACTVVQLDKSTQELDCTPPTSPAGFVSHGYTVTFNNGAATNLTLPINMTSLTPATLYTYKVETNYECAATGTTLQSSQFLTSAYTIPDSPLFTSISPSNQTLDFTLDRNNNNVPPSLSSLHMQFWKASCDSQCVFPFKDSALSSTEIFYECQPYLTGPTTTQFMCPTQVDEASLQGSGHMPCPATCPKACSGNSTGYKCNFPAMIDSRQFHTCTGYDSITTNTISPLTSVSASGTCQVTNLTDPGLSTLEDNCDSSTHCSADEVSSNFVKNNLDAGTQYFARLYYLYNGMVSAETMAAACTKPNSPENVEAGSETTDIVLNVVWNAPTFGNCDGYRFTSTDLSINDENVTSSSLSYNITSGVRGETCYRVQMSCYVLCSDVSGTKTELVGSEVTRDLCSLPGRPVLTLSPLSNNSIFVGIQGQFPIVYDDYELQYSTDNSVFNNVTGGTAVSASNDVGAILGGSGLNSATEYFFRARVKRNGVWSIYSVVESICTFPNEPTNFAASTCDKSSIDMSWDSVSGASGYFIRVRGQSDIFTNVSSGTSHTLSSLSEGQAYTIEIMSFVVCPVSGNVINSSVVSASQFTAPKTPTVTITNAAATPTQITVVLNNYDANLIASVFRNDSQVIGNIMTGSVIDTVPNAGELYQYKVRYSLAEAAPACENGAFSTMFEICSYPGMVTGLDYAVTNSTWTMLHWTAPSGSVTGYRWYIEGSPATDVMNSVNVNITNLTPSQTYFLNVIAYFNCSDGNQLEGAPAGVLVQTMPRSVNLTTLPVSDTEIQITVMTTDAVTNITLFRDGALISSNMASGDFFTDTGRSPGTSYVYTAYGFNNAIQGDISTLTPACTLPSKPTGLAVDSTTANTISISYTIAPTASSAQAKETGGSYTAANNLTTHTFTSLTAASDYSLIIRSAFNCPFPSATLYSLASDALVASTSPNAPTITSVTPLSSTEVIIAFTRDVGLAYTISANGVAAVATGLEATYTIGSLSPGTEHSFTLYATRLGRISDPSTPQLGCTFQLDPAGLNYTLIDGVTATLSWSNPANVGNVDGYVIGLPTTSEITISNSSIMQLNVSLTELTTEDFYVFSYQNCPSSGVLNSSKVVVSVQAGIENFTMSMNGRRTFQVSEFGVSAGNEFTTYRVMSDNFNGTVATLNYSSMPYDFNYAGCAVEDCVLIEATVGLWSGNATNGPICDCSRPCPVTNVILTVYHPNAVLLTFNSPNPADVTYEFEHPVSNTWINIGSVTEYNITGLPPADDVKVAVRSTLVCPSTGELLNSTSVDSTTVGTGPSAGSITSLVSVDVEDEPGRLEVRFAPKTGEEDAAMLYAIWCRTQGFQESSWSSWFLAVSNLSLSDSPYSMQNLDTSTMYSCALSVTLNGHTTDNFNQQIFACTRPAAPTNIQWLRYGYNWIRYGWDHEIRDTYTGGSTCFLVWYENLAKIDNGVSRRKTFNNIANTITPYLMSTQAYQVCAVNSSTFEPFRDCTNSTFGSHITYATVDIVYSDFGQVEAWTGPSMPNITTAVLVDCNTVNVTMTSFDVENGVVYYLKRDGAVIKVDPYKFYVDGGSLEYGVSYDYRITAELTTDTGVILQTDSATVSVCTCPAVPARIEWNTYNPYSLNMSWADSIVTDLRDPAQNTLFSTTFDYWYEIEYNFTNSTGTNIASGVMNTTSLFTHEVTGLPGPSDALDVKLISVIDCQNHQGRIDSYTSVTANPYTRPYDLAMNGSQSGCANENTIQTCVSLNGNIDPSHLYFYMDQGSSSPDTLYHTSTDYTQLCANKTGLLSGTQYNFTASAQKYFMEGNKFSYFQLCTCPGQVVNVDMVGVTESELRVTWDAPLNGAVDMYRYQRNSDQYYNLTSNITQFMHDNLTAGTMYTYNITLQTMFTCQRSDGSEELWGQTKTVEVTGCTIPAAPIVNYTFITDTQVQLNFTQPVGSVDSYIITSDPEMIDPIYALIGSNSSTGRVIYESSIFLLNLEEYVAYTFTVIPVFCNQIGAQGHRVYRVEKPAVGQKFMTLEPEAAVFVLFSAGVGATAILFIAVFVGGKVLFAAPAPPGVAAPAAVAAVEPEVPANWRINNAYEMRADFNVLKFQLGE